MIKVIKIDRIVLMLNLKNPRRKIPKCLGIQYYRSRPLLWFLIKD